MKINFLIPQANISYKGNKFAQKPAVNETINADSFTSKSENKKKKNTLFQKIKNFIHSKAFAIASAITGIISSITLFEVVNRPQNVFKLLETKADLIKEDSEKYARDAYSIYGNSQKIYKDTLKLIRTGAKDNYENFATNDNTMVTFEKNNSNEPTVMNELDENGKLLKQVIIKKDHQTDEYIPEKICEYFGKSLDMYTFCKDSLVCYDEKCRREDGVEKTGRSFVYVNGIIKSCDINSSEYEGSFEVEKCYDYNSENLLYTEGYCENADGTIEAKKIINFNNGKIQRFTKGAKLKDGEKITSAAFDLKLTNDGKLRLNQCNKQGL